MSTPVLAGTAAILVHAPNLIRYGSKPARELAAHPGSLPDVLGSLRSFAQAVAYRPNQALLGAIHPRAMGERPWLTRPLDHAGRFAPFGEIMPEEEFLGLLVVSKAEF